MSGRGTGGVNTGGVMKSITLAVVCLALCLTLVLFALASRDQGQTGSASGSSAGSRYTDGQYQQLTTGMSVDDVDAIMGGGALVTNSDINGTSVVIRMYMNDGGSNVTVSFVDGAMSSKAEAGF